MSSSQDRLSLNAHITLETACRLKAGETLLICTRRTDHRYAPAEEVASIVQALERAAIDMGAVPSVLDLTAFWGVGSYQDSAGAVQQGHELPPARAAMEAADVVLNTMDDLGFSRLIGRTDNDDDFLTAKRRWLYLQHKGMDRWQLEESAVAAIRPRTLKLLELISQARHVHITSPAGTDFHCAMGQGANATPILGIVPLYGEVATAPRQGSESGRIVVDGPTQKGVRRADELDRPPLVIDVADGKAVAWTGDAEQVARLEAFFASGDPQPLYIDEIGIPTSRVMDNDWAWWSDGTHHLERLHIALGNNLRRDSHVHGARHMDLEINRPTMTIDDVTMIEDGRFVGPLENVSQE